MQAQVPIIDLKRIGKLCGGLVTVSIEGGCDDDEGMVIGVVPCSEEGHPEGTAMAGERKEMR